MQKMLIKATINWTFIILICLSFLACEDNKPPLETSKELPVIAYYMGDGEDIEHYALDQLTQIIYCFLHLDGEQLAVDDERDVEAIEKLVALKQKHPHLKILVALGGWGGCETCSEIFSTKKGRVTFARSANYLIGKYNLDGLDLDWEFPAISGYPGHPFTDQDKENFSLLVKELRKAFGNKYEISFAAGAFDGFLEKSVDWETVIPLVDRVNLMTYDFVGGSSATTGHHTALYSTPDQKRSTHRNLVFFDSIGIPSEKLVIGAAFYARVWEGVEAKNNGLFVPGSFKQSLSYKEIAQLADEQPGLTFHWDSVAKAPYFFNPDTKLFGTFDDTLSVRLKTEYALDNKLGGIMFWQLRGDVEKDGLLNAIYQTKMGFQGFGGKE